MQRAARRLRGRPKMNDQHVIAQAAIVQVLLLVVNAALIFWYTMTDSEYQRLVERAKGLKVTGRNARVGGYELVSVEEMK